VGGGGREGERRQMVAAMVAKWMFSMGRVFHFLFLFCFFFFFFFLPKPWIHSLEKLQESTSHE